MGLLTLTEDCKTAIAEWNGEVGRPGERNRKVERIRVFENRFIEDWFATAHFLVPAWTIPVAIAAIAYTGGAAGVLPTIGLFVLGVLAWTLLEYLLHRWLFHRRPSSWEFDKTQMFMLHGYHHEFPNDPLRLVAPPIMAWPGGLLVGGIYCGLFGTTYGLPLLAGTLMGYLAYDWIHYYEHHGKPSTALGKWIRKLHFLHHYDDPEVNHGISSPLWDFFFRTYRNQSRKQVQQSKSPSKAA